MTSSLSRPTTMPCHDQPQCIDIDSDQATLTTRTAFKAATRAAARQTHLRGQPPGVTLVDGCQALFLPADCSSFGSRAAGFVAVFYRRSFAGFRAREPRRARGHDAVPEHW